MPDAAEVGTRAAVTAQGAKAIEVTPQCAAASGGVQLPAVQRTLQVEILTIFPSYFDSPLAVGLLSRAVAGGQLTVACHDLRRWTTDRHRSVDDRPYGGGAGMVMTPGPWFEALDELGAQGPLHTVMLAPDGEPLSQALVESLAARSRLGLLCGRYEGIDARVRTRCDQVVSLGDFVLAGGEAAALAILEGAARLLPGVVGNRESIAEESFSCGLLEYPQYTRPLVYRGMAVPETLTSGDHAAIAQWRQRQSEARTRAVRPDLLGPAPVEADADRGILHACAQPDAEQGGNQADASY